jgi:hypothetical protein
VFGPADGRRIEITYSGGLAHVYLRDLPGRLDLAELDASMPGVIDKLASLDRVGLVMAKSGDGGTLATSAGRFSMRLPLDDQAREALARYDDPDVVAEQLRRLNGFERAGDLVVFGAYDGTKQVNFEAQVGGHGALGGEQLHPFLMVKKEWQFDVGQVTNSSQLYPMLVGLRDARK